MTTVKQLKEFLDQLPDELPVKVVSKDRWDFYAFEDLNLDINYGNTWVELDGEKYSNLYGLRLGNV